VSAPLHVSSGAVSCGGENFDIAAALQASQILTIGHDPERVLPALIEVIRLQSGAETAQLLVLEGTKLRLEASAAADTSDLLLFPASSPDRGAGSFSSAIVNYVLHSGEDLMLSEADKDPRFVQCNYVANRRPKSVICSGIRHQGELLGVIYLEHGQIAGAFSGKKLEWLRLLSTEVGLTVASRRMSRYRDYVRKFAPSAVAKEIDINPNSPDLAAKDCDVSILFADLEGYTRIAELMGTRQLTELMNRTFSKFVDEIHRYEGVLLEIGGDELFALFGDEDTTKHVWKAANAALAISRGAKELKEELASAHVALTMNMGINSGVASVGLHSVEAASGSRWRYGASGTVVNIAARVRQLARNGDILMTADSAAKVTSDFLFEDVGEHSLKNVAKRVRIYRLLGSAANLTSAPAAQRQLQH
jgi:class 3 adenylate cyclase